MKILSYFSKESREARKAVRMEKKFQRAMEKDVKATAKATAKAEKAATKASRIEAKAKAKAEKTAAKEAAKAAKLAQKEQPVQQDQVEEKPKNGFLTSLKKYLGYTLDVLGEVLSAVSICLGVIGTAFLGAVLLIVVAQLVLVTTIYLIVPVMIGYGLCSCINVYHSNTERVAMTLVSIPAAIWAVPALGIGWCLIGLGVALMWHADDMSTKQDFRCFDTEEEADADVDASLSSYLPDEKEENIDTLLHPQHA